MCEPPTSASKRERLYFTHKRAEYEERSSAPRNPNPQLIITLIHGTFARNADWTRPNSELRKALLTALYDWPKPPIVKTEYIYIRNFRWSGRNNLFDRTIASKRLLLQIQNVKARFPSAKHIIIAHSHAGNIALMTLKDLEDASAIDGIACLSTPFFHVDIRGKPDDVAKILSDALAFPIILLSVLVQYLLELSFAGLIMLLIFGGVFGVIFERQTVRKLWDKLPAIWEVLNQMYFARMFLPNVPILLLRSAGDEASLALGLGQLSNWFGNALYARLSKAKGLKGVLLGPLRILSSFAVVVSIAFTRVWLGTRVPPGFKFQNEHGKAIGAYDLAAMVKVHTEPTPAGAWRVVHAPSMNDELGIPDPDLEHSIYDNRIAITLLCKWINTLYGNGQISGEPELL